MTYSIGALIDKRYRIVDIVGSGAHGVVFRAEDINGGPFVAVKCLHPGTTEDPTLRTRLTREASVADSLADTSAARVFACNTTSDGIIYIVMELMEGQNLDTYLKSMEALGQKLGPSHLIELLAPIANTLSVAHSRGILHRDIKPANIFILQHPDAQGPVRLLDFGLAKQMDAAALTKDGTVLGSPHYIAPEVWKGKPQELDARVDVYSLGAVVFRALAGRVPFDVKGTMQILIAVTRGKRPSLHALRPDLPPAVDAWVERALAAAKESRFANIEELWTALEEVLKA
jgi:eukaryotic-like serine/threonine-protein kinase